MQLQTSNTAGTKTGGYLIKVRKPALRERTGRCSDATITRRVRAGLLPPPVYECSMPIWFEHELAAIDQARLRGADDEAVRVLVRELVAARNAPQPQAA